METVRHVLGTSLGVIIFRLNITEIRLLTKRTKKKPHERLLLSASLSDMLIGLSDFTVEFAFVLESVKESIDELAFSLYFCFLCISILQLILFSMERVWSFSLPNTHKKYANGLILKGATVLCWIVPFIITVYIPIYHLHHTNSKRGSEYCNLMATMIAVIILAADSIFILVYSIIACLICGSKTAFMSIEQQITRRRQMKTLHLCTYHIAAFVVCSTPFAVIYMVEWQLPNAWATNVLVSYSAVNSLIVLGQYYFNRSNEK